MPTSPIKKDFHLPGREPWARDHERRHHAEALFGFGEWAMFVLMWHHDDLRSGLVGRCQRCRGHIHDDPSKAEAIFDAYKAPVEAKCPSCYGTTFEGGWKAKIIRPALFVDEEEDQTYGTRGVLSTNSAQVQSTSDFHARRGDFAFRADGTRWQLGRMNVTKLIDGFSTPSRVDNNLGVSVASAVREDRSSIAHKIEPTDDETLARLLERVGGHFRTDYQSFDEIRGPLLPEANNASPVDYTPHDNLPGSPEINPWP